MCIATFPFVLAMIVFMPFTTPSGKQLESEPEPRGYFASSSEKLFETFTSVFTKIRRDECVNKALNEIDIILRMRKTNLALKGLISILVLLHDIAFW